MTASPTPLKVLNEYGELIQELPKGTRFITPEQQQAYNTKREREAKHALIEAHRTNQRRTLGYFCFLSVNNVFTDVSPPLIPKIIMLASYADYKRQLMMTLKTPMRRADITKILGLSRSAAYQFWNAVNGRFFTEDESHFLHLNTPNIFRSKIPNDLRGAHLQKVYIKTVRELYRNTDIRKHTQLGYVFQLLPYVNMEYNLVCVDPFQSQLESIEPLTVKEICQLIGYDCTQAKRLIMELKSLHYTYRGRIEYLISYVDNGAETHGAKKIFINPHVVYNGSDYRRVEILGAFCAADKKLSTSSGQADYTHFQQHSSVKIG